MCGICGIVGTSDPHTVDGMTRVLAHRGPDGRGIEAFPAAGRRPPAALGHTRLSIIDTSERGTQPMCDASGRFWLSYNGEIYNFPELRAELESRGHRFRSGTDTEVLIELFARDGTRCLSRLNGMFAFAVWDTETGTMVIVRDRLGIKPLYWTMDGRRLAFASEAKALLTLGRRATIRLDALPAYLTFLWVPDPDTLFQGIYKLPPGHYASFADGHLTTTQWWDFEFDPEYQSEATWRQRVTDTVSAAVRRQRISDVPLGSFLSGGLDSSAIVAELARDGERPITYTAGFSADDLAHDVIHDDLRYARSVADQLGVEYNEQVLSAELAELLPKLVWHMDEPVADPAAMTTYLICKAAREKLTVILSGVGGDEMFAGYGRHLAARLARAADIVPRPLRRGMRQLVESHVGIGPPGRLRRPRRHVLKLMRGLDLPPVDRYLTYSSYYRPDELAAVWSSDVRSALDGIDPSARHREHLSRVRDQPWLNQILYLDLKTFLPCLNLTYTDKMSMAASTEVRVPLLDDELVALSARIPPELKLRRTTQKYIFKRSMEGRVPHEVIWRPKAGFTAPVRSWIVGDLQPLVDDLLSPERVRARGLFAPREVTRMIEDFRTGREDNALRIWALLTLELWQQQFTDRGAPESLSAVAA